MRQYGSAVASAFGGAGHGYRSQIFTFFLNESFDYRSVVKKKEWQCQLFRKE